MSQLFRTWTLVLLSALLCAAGCQRRTATPLPPAVPGLPRIVSLAPSLTEMICAVGGADRLVGRTDVCNYPSNLLTHVPIVAKFGRPYLEPMLAQKPTLVLEIDLEDKSLNETLGRLGIGHQHIECRRLTDIPGAIRAIGLLVDRKEAAEQLAVAMERGIQARLAATRQVPLAQRPLVYAEIWDAPPMTAGRNSFVSELVALAGGRNLGDDLPCTYGTVSSEWVLTRNPEVILCIYMENNQHTRQAVCARTGWQTLRAVQNQRVYDGFTLDTILRPGPRVLEGVDQLHQAIQSAP